MAIVFPFASKGSFSKIKRALAKARPPWLLQSRVAGQGVHCFLFCSCSEAPAPKDCFPSTNCTQTESSEANARRVFRVSLEQVKRRQAVLSAGDRLSRASTRTAFAHLVQTPERPRSERCFPETETPLPEAVASCETQSATASAPFQSRPTSASPFSETEAFGVSASEACLDEEAQRVLVLLRREAPASAYCASPGWLLAAAVEAAAAHGAGANPKGLFKRFSQIEEALAHKAASGALDVQWFGVAVDGLRKVVWVGEIPSELDEAHRKPSPPSELLPGLRCLLAAESGTHGAALRRFAPRCRRPDEILESQRRRCLPGFHSLGSSCPRGTHRSCTPTRRRRRGRSSREALG